MPDALTFYLNKIERLRIDRSHGKPAPHKPILLLAVIDLFEEGAITNNKIEPSPPIVESFLKYWHLVSLEKPRIFLPFFHLKSDKFWHLTRQSRKRKIAGDDQTDEFDDASGKRRRICEFGRRFVFTSAPQPRHAKRFAEKLSKSIFRGEAEMFRAVIADNREINNIEHLLLESAEKENPEIAKTVADTPKRNIAFRRAIIRLYNYTCAACRLRLITLDGETAVEAAHIFPFAQSYDDSIGNGLSLCPLHHWSFDKGLFSIDDNYKMIVSNKF